jgi:TDG/mug DNA glycosylase family protein
MSHRVSEKWMGEQIETLEDLLRPGLHAVCIGINPAPTSVRAGHYYQGRLGQQFYERLRRAELLPHASGWEDDLAYENGIGFTDIVKRPTAKAREVRADEYAARLRSAPRKDASHAAAARDLHVQEDSGGAVRADRREWTH